MAAVTNNIESHELDSGKFEKSDIAADGGGSLQGFNAAAVNQKSLAKSHTMLTKFAWLRTLLEKEVQKRSYQLVNDRGWYMFEVTPGFDKATLPWAPFPSDGYKRFSLWSSENAKMAAPSFALPAGGVFTGGTCPGADAGQTITPVQQRIARLESGEGGWQLRVVTPGGTTKSPVKEGLTICSSCYATGGNFSYANNQTAEIIRYWWLRKHLQAGNEELLLSVFIDSIKHLKFKPDRHGIKPIRLHDSGDFFSYKYAELWIRIADELAVQDPAVVIWAPTRTWAQGGWSEFWASRLGGLKSLTTAGRPNLTVRPSGYNFGDAAPGRLHASNAKGTTSLFAPNAKVAPELKNKTDPKTVGLTQGVEPRCDFNCGVYGAEEHSCTASKAPDGKRGCRACWIHPELSVQYSSH